MSVDHYENFPVASWLCPPALRPAVQAIYHFARTADDIADEGDASPSDRLASLARYRQALESCVLENCVETESHRPGIFGPLADAIARHDLPMTLLHDLLDAFEQDVRNPPYPDRAALLDYCRRSANPVGRLLLHLYGIKDADALRRSDCICSALQLINFWQDMSIDLPRGRCYVPLSDLKAHELDVEMLRAGRNTAATQRLTNNLVAWAWALMAEGAPLALRVPGRAGWELRLVVQGGLRILEKIQRMDYACLDQRPRLQVMDGPLLLWRAIRMGSAR